MTKKSEKRQPGSEIWNQEDYPALTPQERELMIIQALIDKDGQTP